ncbi:MAG: creatininase family protein [Rubrimonas sp.]|uniref:creatininase family protein n=1 Tax=Rubrimonas sp. TaxID=2036015 RepID=UPI002FDE6374
MLRSWGDFGAGPRLAVEPARTVAVLATAAVEQHGPHLPLSTDSEIAAGLLRETGARLPDDLDIRLLPLQMVGKSNEHLHVAGTLTLPAELATALWVEIGLSVARAGVRKMVVVNSHGGNADLISIAARELRVRAGMLCVRCHWGAFGTPEGLFSAREREFGIHGGDYETSLMLHFRPDLVDMGAARDFANSGEGAGLLRPTGPVGYGWIAADVNPEGVAGEAHLATAEKGSLAAAHQAEGFAALLREVAALDLSNFGAFGA